MEADQVLKFLEKHPSFLQEHSVLFGISPTLERVISISERQLLESRDKYRILEKNFNILVENAKLNDLIQKNLQKLTLLLLRAEKLDTLIKDLQNMLSEVFLLKSTAFRIWHELAVNSCYYKKASVDVLRQIKQQEKIPITTQYINNDILAWLPKTPVLQSFALLPLISCQGDCFGLLVFGSDDHERFSPKKNSDYLLWFSEQISAAIDNLLMNNMVN